MKLIKYLILFLLAVPVWATSYTMSTSGDWHTSTNWTPNGVPGNCDTASIPDTFTVTVSDTRIIGCSATAGTVVLNLNITGALIISNGGTLKVRGDGTYTGGAGHTATSVTVQGGGAWYFDSTLAASPSTTHYSFYQSADGGYRQFIATGSSGNYATVGSVNTAGSGYFQLGGHNFGGGFTATYTHFTYLGTTSFPSFDTYWQGGSNVQWNVTHSTFDHVSKINFSSVATSSTSVFIHNFNVHTNSLGDSGGASGDGIFTFYSQGNIGTGQLENNVFDIQAGGATGFSPYGLTISGNYFAATFNWTTWICSSMSDNFVLFVVAGGATVPCSTTNSYIAYDLDIGNPHYMDMSPASNQTMSGDVFAVAGTQQGGQGSTFEEQPIATSGFTYTMTNNIILPDNAGFGNAWWMVMIGATSVNVIVNHNTMFSGPNTAFSPIATSGIATGHNSGHNAAGSVSQFNSNLFFNPNLSGYMPFTWYKWDNIGFGTDTDVVSPANADYNGSWNMPACSTAFSGQGRGYCDLFSSTPGVHDVDISGGSSVLFEYQRTMELWDSKYLGNHPTAWSSGATYAVGNMVSVTSTAVYWNLPVNYRYTNGAGCSGANPQPGVAATTWRNCWEWASEYRVRQAIAAGTAWTDSSIGVTGADATTTMLSWIRAGYAPTSSSFKGHGLAASDIGAVPAVSLCVTVCEATLPGAQTYQSIVAWPTLTAQDMRIEFRVIGATWATTCSYCIDVAGFGIHFGGGTFAAFTPDTVSGGATIFPGVPNGDISGRLTRSVNGAVCPYPAPGGQGCWTVEIYDTATGKVLAETYAFITTSATNSAIKNGVISFGNSGATGYVGYVRWYSTLVAIGTPVPLVVASPADLGDWEFRNNGNDTSSASPTQTLVGFSAYGAGPTYAPVCNPGTQQTASVGSTMTLNGGNSYPLDGGFTLTYVWSVLTGTATLSSSTIAGPVASNLTGFGPENFQLITTDGSSQSTTCSIHNGAVIVDSNGIINLTAEGLDATSQHFIGPLIANGRNHWPWADTVQLYTLNTQIVNRANNYSPYWRVNAGGTVSVSAGSPIITGTGTDLTAPCGGTSTPLAGAVFILHYIGTDSGRDHWTEWPVVSCNSTTSLTIPSPWVSNNTPWPVCSSACSGLSWSWGYQDTSHGNTGGPPYDHVPFNQWVNWTYGQAPDNYYDNNKSLYSEYWRSGIDTYLTEFQAATDAFWEFPVYDQGYGCWSSNGSGFNGNNDTCFAPGAWRSMALQGVVLRALQEGSGSPKWAGLKAVWQLARSWQCGGPPYSSCGSVSTTTGMDTREEGYSIGILAMCAIADPDGPTQTGCKDALVNTLPRWTALKRTDSGTWSAFFYNNLTSPVYTSITSLGQGGSVCVKNSNTSVVGTGVDWTAIAGLKTYKLGTFWTFDGSPTAIPLDNTHGDSQTYSFTVVDATHLTINPAYQGTTNCTGTSGTDRGYIFGYPQGGGNDDSIGNDPTAGFTGWGQQPYSLGIWGQGLFMAADAISTYSPSAAATYRAYGDSVSQWLISNAHNTGLGGFLNMVDTVGCASGTITSANIACYCGGCSGNNFTSTGATSREGQLEAARLFSEDYLLFPSSATKTAVDTFWTEAFSKPGTGAPTGDGYYLWPFDPGGLFVSGFPPQGTAPKWTGQVCGYTEGCDMWPAVRLWIMSHLSPMLSGGARTGGSASLP